MSFQEVTDGAYISAVYVAQRLAVARDFPDAEVRLQYFAYSIMASLLAVPLFEFMVVLHQLERVDEAKLAAQRFMQLAPAMKLNKRLREMPYRDQEFKKRYWDALRVAGVRFAKLARCGERLLRLFRHSG